jgi:riboflavin biosynthesis pyrimidine reductase
MERFTRLYPDRSDGLSPVDVASDLPGNTPADRPWVCLNMISTAGCASADRPWVCLNMISTADGRATIKGRAGNIANRADYELFHATRARMDGIMVGAETIRVEGYGRTINNAEARERRVREGLPADAVTVLATRSANLPADVGLLRQPANTVIVLTPSADAELPPGVAATVHYVREADMATGLRRVREEFGVRSLVCEGGPNLNATLLPAGLIDELHLVYAPKLAGGKDPLTILAGGELDPAIELGLLSLHESGGYLFCRYAVGR